MHSVKFGYKKRGHFLVPIIPLTLFGRETISVEAYIDSGAAYSIFETAVVENLKINLKGARKRMFIVGDGSFIPGHIIYLPIKIGDIKFRAEIAFSDKLNVGFNLLGRKGIFDHFDEIIFREKKNEIEFRITNGHPSV